MTIPRKQLQNLLDQSDWVDSLSDLELRQVTQEIIVRDFAANALVCRKGEAVDSWVGVIDGIVKISSVSLDGKAVTLTGIPAGAWLGEGSLLKDEARRYDVVAIRESRVAYMPRATFQRLLDSNIAFNRFLLKQLNERLGQFIAMVEFERLLGPEARVARCLAQMFNPVLFPGNNRRLDIAQHEIGLLTGLSRQRVNQALKSLEAKALLKVEYGAIQIQHLSRLEAYE